MTIDLKMTKETTITSLLLQKRTGFPVREPSPDSVYHYERYRYAEDDEPTETNSKVVLTLSGEVVTTEGKWHRVAGSKKPDGTFSTAVVTFTIKAFYEDEPSGVIGYGNTRNQAIVDLERRVKAVGK